jgi:hypothetical protein
MRFKEARKHATETVRNSTNTWFIQTKKQTTFLRLAKLKIL